ncbi:antitoxin VbhA family protein [Corynebacterium sp. A21]|uniref:antitoxin VbhA family protein n=1 Tax=Corynebacterium sp. A21 TaxID=3457318 RepID=UPI003FD14E4C
MADTEVQVLRQRQVEDAEHSGQMEGLEISAVARQAADSFISGELDINDLVTQVSGRYGHA